MFLRWMGTSQVRFLFIGCERLDEDSTLTGEWNKPSQLTGDYQVCATVPPQTGAEVRLSQIPDRGACWRCPGCHRTPCLAIATQGLYSVAGGMHNPLDDALGRLLEIRQVPRGIVPRLSGCFTTIIMRVMTVAFRYNRQASYPFSSRCSQNVVYLMPFWPHPPNDAYYFDNHC
jgi:hypothetical protein